MLHHDNVSEALEAFIKQLPNPRHSLVSTIESEIDVKGQRLKFVAQKAKGRTGITWKVYPVSLSELNRHY